VIRALLSLVLVAVAAPSAQPSVKDVMRRVAAYVDSYGERAAIVVATERYTQKTTGNTDAPRLERRLVAEFALVKVDVASGWIGFRDVLEVDGRTLPDREERLIRSISSGGGYAEAQRLSDESARYNIGTIERNFNVPTTTLFYFRSNLQDRFKFAAKTVEQDGSWHITFKETSRPTLIRTPDNESVPSEGDIWVNPEDGTVLRTILRTELKNLRHARMQRGDGQVAVTYRYVALIGMWLPAEMSERFETTGTSGRTSAWERVEGKAEYSNYRQFTTSGRIK
jgi:hypothetical protein